MYENDSSTDTLRDRLAKLNHRIERMKALNVTHGDVLALRLIEHAKVERKALLAQMTPAERA